MGLPRDVTTDIAAIAERVRNSDCLLFDCDGVILNSNHIKTEAFRQVASRFCIEAADNLVRFHLEHGGISRFEKFRYLADRLSVEPSDREEWVQQRCQEFASLVRSELLTCEAADGLLSLRETLKKQRWYVVSGGQQSELREVFSLRGLARLFDGGIHGSPRNKDQILQQLAKEGAREGLFLGDSRYDCEVASRQGHDFLFIHAWTDVSDWQGYCSAKRVDAIPGISDIADIICSDRAGKHSSKQNHNEASKC